MQQWLYCSIATSSFPDIQQKTINSRKMRHLPTRFSPGTLFHSVVPCPSSWPPPRHIQLSGTLPKASLLQTDAYRVREKTNVLFSNAAKVEPANSTAGLYHCREQRSEDRCSTGLKTVRRGTDFNLPVSANTHSWYFWPHHHSTLPFMQVVAHKYSAL